MLVVIACQDKYLRDNVATLVSAAGLRSIRTLQLDRVLMELKQPERCVIVDMTWEAVQGPGVLRQFVNVGNITRNKVVCICPNQDEDLKTMARQVRPHQVFIRFDLNTTFKDFLKTL